jgi:hypothetical protein
MHKGLTVGGRKRMIRVYRSLANDSTVLYGYVNVPADYMHPEGQSVTRPYRKYTVSGAILDDAGLVELSAPEKIYTGVYGGQPSSWRFSSNGSAVSRPPYIQQCQVSFSDIEQFANRLWGIGDPFFPQRLYYSEENSIYEWGVTNYLLLDADDNDQAVALMRGNSDKGLYAFKHNKTYLVTGYDPEYDLQLQLANDHIGAVNRSSVAQIGQRIFTFSPDLRVYEVTEGFKEISWPIRNDIETCFVSYENAIDHARLFVFDNDILLTYYDSTVKQRCFAYDLVSGVWSLRQYPTGYMPVQTFSYDTAQNSTGFSDYLNWALPGTGTILMKRTTQLDSHIGEDILNDTPLVSIPINFSYKTPFVGDGEKEISIRGVDFSGDIPSGSTLYLTVYGRINGVDSALSRDVFTVGATALQDYRFGLSKNYGQYLTLGVTTNSNITLSDLTLDVVEVGHVRKK